MMNEVLEQMNKNSHDIIDECLKLWNREIQTGNLRHLVCEQLKLIESLQHDYAKD